MERQRGGTVLQSRNNGDARRNQRGVSVFEGRTVAPPRPPRGRPQMEIPETRQSQPLAMYRVEVTGGLGKKGFAADVDVDLGENAGGKKGAKPRKGTWAEGGR